MDKNDVYTVIALMLCLISVVSTLTIAVNIFYRRPMPKLYRVVIDSPTVNIWKEREETVDDVDRDFNVKYDLVEEK